MYLGAFYRVLKCKELLKTLKPQLETKSNESFSNSGELSLVTWVARVAKTCQLICYSRKRNSDRWEA